MSSQNGAICLDILKDQWSPALTLKTALLSIQAMMSAPEPDDPQDAVVARQYLSQREEFDNTARFWTETYAQPQKAASEKVQQLVEMGFAEDKVKEALARCGDDANTALELLCADA